MTKKVTLEDFLPLKCPSCGSMNIAMHEKGTFIPDGVICCDCFKVFYPDKTPRTLNNRLAVKGWRKAWYEK